MDKKNEVSQTNESTYSKDKQLRKEEFERTETGHEQTKAQEDQIKEAEENKKREDELALQKQEEKENRRKELSEKLAVAIKEHNGIESDIPISHEYWNWLTEYRSL